MSVVKEQGQKTRGPIMLAAIDGMLTEFVNNPERLEDPARVDTLAQAIAMSHPDGVRFIVRRLHKERRRWEQVLAALKALQTENLELVWVLTKDFPLNGGPLRFVYALGLNRPEVPQLLRVMDKVPDENADGQMRKLVDLPSPPYLGTIEPKTRLLVGLAPQAPPPPMMAQTLQATSANPETTYEGIGEIEVAEGPDDRICTVFATRELAYMIQDRLARGERVVVRVERGVVTAIHSGDPEQQGDFVETIAPDGPGVKDLILPRALRRQWERDVAAIVQGRSVRVLLIGPTGTGKTSAAERVGRDAFRRKTQAGDGCKGIRLVRISSQDIGSSYIHATERNIKKAMRIAEQLHRDGYIVVILLDEGDQMLGEMMGAEHAHNRSERLALQALLSKDLPVAVYVTCNPRQNSWLPAAIERRFTKRVYGRPIRRQIEEVARYYVSAHPQVLEQLDLTASEFAGRMADNLFSDQRVIAVCHLYSGDKIFIRARDLQTCSPGKIKQLIETFCCDVEDGRSKGLEDLSNMMDEEFLSPSLNVRNVFEMTFLQPPHNDAIRTLELTR